MRFKLSFSKTSVGALRVSAMAAHGSDHVLSIYDNDEVFLRLLDASGLAPETLGSLRSSAERAFGSSNTPTCCEEVELTEEQLSVLRLSEARRLYA